MTAHQQLENCDGERQSEDGVELKLVLDGEESLKKNNCMVLDGEEMS